MGEYVLGDLKMAPKGALMSEEYAKANTTLPGKTLYINETSVLFDQKTFYHYSTEKMNRDKARRYFNIYGGYADLLCGGSIDENGFATGELDVYVFCAEEYHIITVVLNQKGELMLWLTLDQYEYMGFYELIPAE